MCVWIVTWKRRMSHFCISGKRVLQVFHRPWSENVLAVVSRARWARERQDVMWKALVKGIAVHPTVQARHPWVIFTSTTFSHLHPPIESFQEYFPLHQSLCPCPVQSLIDCLLGSIKSSLSSSPLRPLNLSSPLALTHSFMDSQWSIISTTWSSYSPLLFLDFPVKPSNQWQTRIHWPSPPLQECPGGTGRDSVILWYGGDKAHNGLAIQLDVGMNPRVATCSWVFSLSEQGCWEEQGGKSDKENKMHDTAWSVSPSPPTPAPRLMSPDGENHPTVQIEGFHSSRSQKCRYLPHILVSTMSHVPRCHS